jgi:transcriptional regulator with XRE-family HTH domain
MSEPLLVARREQNRWTQRELGDRIDVDPSAISRLENELRRGEDPTCPGHLKAASAELGIDPNEAANSVEIEVSINGE